MLINLNIILLLSQLIILPAVPSERDDCARYKEKTIAIYITGNELGAMQPCGCSGGQLGGFDRRPAVINRTPKDRRLVIDTGQIVESDSEQELIKFNIAVQAYDMMGYDLLCLKPQDIQTARNLGLSGTLNSSFNIISEKAPKDVNIPAFFTKEFGLKNSAISVKITAKNSADFSKNTDNIIILLEDDKTAEQLTDTEKNNADCIIVKSESEKPVLVSEPNQSPLIFTIGRYGEYVCELKITPASEKTEKPEIKLNIIPVTEKLPKSDSLVQLYDVYKQLLRQANLLEKYPRYVLPDDLEYVGSKVCKMCHEYEYEKWSQKAHAGAWKTLVDVGSQYDPECVICHVVGMEYETGFVSPEKSPEGLKNVGCEACHGPGSEHLASLGETPTGIGGLGCTDCHTPDKSHNYAGNEDEYFEKIIHWREPNEPSDVK